MYAHHHHHHQQHHHHHDDDVDDGTPVVLINITGMEERVPDSSFRANPRGMSVEEFYARKNPPPSVEDAEGIEEAEAAMVKDEIARLRQAIINASGSTRARLLADFEKFADSLSSEKLKMEIADFCAKAASLVGARANPSHSMDSREDRELIRKYCDGISDPQYSPEQRHAMLRELRQIASGLMDARLRGDVLKFCDDAKAYSNRW